MACALCFLAAACSAGGAGPVGDAGTTGPGIDGAGAPDVANPHDATASDAGAGGDATDAATTVDAPSSADAPSSDADAAAALQAHADADDAVEAMLLAFFDPGQKYLDATRGTTTLTGYWTYQQAWDAVLDAVERHQGSGTRFTGTLRTFYETQNAIGWSRDYYDDENWATLALIRAYDLTGDATYLVEAKTLYADIMAAWDTTCCGTTAGGLWWDRAHTQKATAANAGAVVSGARLYERTNDAQYLTFAQQAFTFWAANMVDPTTHQVIDHLTPSGQKVAWKYTYNEGLMIGAAVALAHAGGSSSSIALAEQIASFVLTSETEASALGPILTDGTDAACTGDCMQFKGIAARYLAALYQADPGHPEYLALLTRSAGAAWTIARDPSSRLFGADWGAPFSAPAQLEATSSAAMTLAAVAILEGSAPPDPPGVYEAEEGVLHSVGLEAVHGAFDGWGYVAGWNADGQWVDFFVAAPTAGQYDLAFRYAAGAGDASRLVYVNGANAVANQKLASTASWDSYGTVTMTVGLAAGTNTVSLIYNSSLGSTNYVNLDRLTVSKH
jgi:predicted alpha-1,6-mannanase (GH76 family)